jgi:integrase
MLDLGRNWDERAIFMPRRTSQDPKPKVWPAVYPRYNSAGEITSWRVDCGGKSRLRFSYKTKAEANGKAELLRLQRENEGNSILDFQAADRIDATDALDLLKPHGVTLRQAADFYLKNIAVIRSNKTIEEAVTELLTVKAKDESSKRYAKDLRLKLSSFSEQFQNRPLHEIARAELVQWLYSLEVSPVTRKNYSRALSVLFSFAVDRHYVVSHPAHKLVTDKPSAKKPGFLTALEAKALLLSAEPDFVVALALGLFAGLRPEAEIWPLDWRRIKLAKRIVDIDKSKNVMSHRHVRISENLAAWLAPLARPHGQVAVKGDSYYSRLERARQGAILRLEAAGEPVDNLRDWPQDALRHTYATMHSAAFANPNDTSAQMGHAGGLNVFSRHYRDRVEEPEARSFWEIYPPEKIVALPQSASAV